MNYGDICEPRTCIEKDIAKGVININSGIFTERERKYLKLRYIDRLNVRAVALRMYISEATRARIHKKIFEKLGSAYSPRHDPCDKCKREYCEGCRVIEAEKERAGLIIERDEAWLRLKARERQLCEAAETAGKLRKQLIRMTMRKEY